jgi:hypothetical protein
VRVGAVGFRLTIAVLALVTAGCTSGNGLAEGPAAPTPTMAPVPGPDPSPTPGPQGPVVSVSTADELVQALSSLASGQTLELAAGTYRVPGEPSSCPGASVR